MFANKIVVYAKFVEAVQRFVRQYNIPLLSYVFSDPAFFIGWKLFCAFVYLYLFTWKSSLVMFSFSTNVSTILIKFPLSIFLFEKKEVGRLPDWNFNSLNHNEISRCMISENDVKIELRLHVSQSAFTCSNLTIETLERSVKYVQS